MAVDRVGAAAYDAPPTPSVGILSLLNDSERVIVGAVAALADCNPFLPERLELERQALGSAFTDGGLVWHADADLATANPNLEQLRALVERLGEDLRQRLLAGTAASDAERAAYHGLVRYLLFQRYEDAWYAQIEAAEASESGTGRVAAYARFVHDLDHFLSVAGATEPAERDAAHLFALGFQVRRAFHHIFRQIFGGSMPAARLRAAVWQSIFTRDLRRYRRALYDRIGDVTTLITGESGTGKELVARAIALSRYVPFDGRAQTFVTDYRTTMQAVNLSALTPTLIESELFGHRRGAFTGAINDKKGLFQEADGGTIFLDEVGSMSPMLQSRLLRVLQEREIRRVGDNTPIYVDVRVVAASNEPLEKRIKEGTFREDLYYRLNVIPIHLPPLRERSDDIPLLVAHFLLSKTSSRSGRPYQVTRQAMDVLCAHDWPGNVRELENAIERAVTLCDGELVRIRDLPPRLTNKLAAPIPEESPEAAALPNLPGNAAYPLQRSAGSDQPAPPPPQTNEPFKPLKNHLRDQELMHLNRALQMCGGDKEKAALLLGVSLATLYRKLAGEDRDS
jgi:DNA-binding NtrC family response regulator